MIHVVNQREDNLRRLVVVVAEVILIIGCQAVATGIDDVAQHRECIVIVVALSIDLSIHIEVGKDHLCHILVHLTIVVGALGWQYVHHLLQLTLHKREELGCISLFWEVRADTGVLVGPWSRTIEIEQDIIGEGAKGTGLSSQFVTGLACTLDEELITESVDHRHAGEVQTEITVGSGPLLELQTIQSLVAPGDTCLVGREFLQVPETTGEGTLTSVVADDITTARTVGSGDGECGIDLRNLLLEGALVSQGFFWSQRLIGQGLCVEVVHTGCRCHHAQTGYEYIFEILVHCRYV